MAVKIPLSTSTMSVREMRKAGLTVDGTFASVPAKKIKVKPVHPKVKTFFEAGFKVGNEVSIIRTEHGWFDGRISGKIVKLSDYHCVVEVTEDPSYRGRYDIDHPRDIRKSYL